MVANTSKRTATSEPEECSNYMRELTQYLSNIMSSVLLGVPTEIKDMIYLDALSHAAANILVRPALRPQSLFEELTQLSTSGSSIRPFNCRDISSLP